MAHYRYYIVNDWIKMLDIRIQNKPTPPPLMKALDNNKWVIFNSELKNNQSSSDRLCVYLSILRIGIRNKKWLDVINVG